jgi:hypothetical protein
MSQAVPDINGNSQRNLSRDFMVVVKHHTSRSGEQNCDTSNVEKKEGGGPDHGEFLKPGWRSCITIRRHLHQMADIELA